MSTLVTDTLGGTPYTDWVPKPNFHGPSFTYFDPDLDQIQLLFGLPGEPVVFPAVGSYPFPDIHLACVTQDCAQHFGPDVLFAVSGELRIGAVPEPEAAALLASGALLGMALLAAKSGRTRRFSLLWPCDLSGLKSASADGAIGGRLANPVEPAGFPEGSADWPAKPPNLLIIPDSSVIQCVRATKMGAPRGTRW